ncbi:F0F1 ATP synthase subunit delta [Georgenia sp. 10Sc9-8]|uniref:ATP synthase subunit delta n=1 Tax=Georgenia halotolerans TaxID=3028317 RepID=A0ABT5TU80_9MICO|nr:F0F1 ATP synthase subunit delta [Georgenia halotolerans]
MRASSQSTFEAAQERWEPVLLEAGERARAFGEQLFGVADLLDRSAGLRRSLTDSARPGQDKAALVDRLLAGKVDPAVVDLLGGLARGRWSDEDEFVESVNRLAVDAVLAAAQNAGRLDRLQDEVFRLERLLASNRELRRALAQQEATAERRGALVDQLVQDKVTPETQVLMHRVVTRAGRVAVGSGLHEVAELAAARRDRLVATVTAAVPLSRQQIDRLRTTLERAYGQQLQVNVGVEPSLLGGLRVHVGDEVIDGSVLARLEDARRRMAG